VLPSSVFKLASLSYIIVGPCATHTCEFTLQLQADKLSLTHADLQPHLCWDSPGNADANFDISEMICFAGRGMGMCSCSCQLCRICGSPYNHSWHRGDSKTVLARVSQQRPCIVHRGPFILCGGICGLCSRVCHGTTMHEGRTCFGVSSYTPVTHLLLSLGSPRDGPSLPAQDVTVCCPSGICASTISSCW